MARPFVLVLLVASLITGSAAAQRADLAKARSLGPMMNTILGALGGVGGGQWIADSVGGGMAGDIGTSALIGALLPLAVSFFVKKKEGGEPAA